VRRPSSEWLLLLLVVLPLGCIAQYEEPAEPQPDSAREQAGAQDPTAIEAPVAAQPAQPAERSLDDIAIELARNEAKLRALGVVLPSRSSTTEKNLGNEGEEDAVAPEAEPPRPGGAGSGITPKPDSQPSTAPAPKGETGSATGSSQKQGQGRRDNKPKKKTEDADASDRFAQPPPEEAKATPLSPTEQPKLDAATRCIQVCELSEITCELGVQICELAQRHAGDDDYEQACARATDDCDAAQEACDVCAG
jgi:hypothetical protein